MEERQQHEAAVAEYKQVHAEHYAWLCGWTVCWHTNIGFQVFQQLDEGHLKQQEELSQELLEVKVRPNFPPLRQDKQSSTLINILQVYFFTVTALILHVDGWSSHSSNWKVVEYNLKIAWALPITVSEE